MLWGTEDCKATPMALQKGNIWQGRVRHQTWPETWTLGTGVAESLHSKHWQCLRAGNPQRHCWLQASFIRVSSISSPAQLFPPNGVQTPLGLCTYHVNPGCLFQNSSSSETSDTAQVPACYQGGMKEGHALSTPDFPKSPKLGTGARCAASDTDA